MYAVIETGGKQYRVELGTELEVELLDAQPGQEITLDRVLLVADGDEAAVGRPLVGDASVHAEVLRQDRGEKLISFKYRPKARRRVKKGHRQELTVLRITDLLHKGRSAAETARKAEADAKTERQRLEEAAARQAAEDAALAAKLAARSASAAGESTTAEPAAPRRGRRSTTRPVEPPESAEPAETAEAAAPAAGIEAGPEGERAEETTADSTSTEPEVPAAEPPPNPDENPEEPSGSETPTRRRSRTTKDE